MNTSPRDATPRGDEGFGAHWFSGQHVYGNDFDAAGVAQWFADEEHAYAELAGADRSTHTYGYHAFNARHGFAHLPRAQHFASALGFGSNFGDELLPLLPHIDRLTLMDSSSRYQVGELAGQAVHYVMAQACGDLALPSRSMNLITVFSVLHHIPNVSHVLNELARVLAPGGWLVLREPVTTMGDWRVPRQGLTQHERGLPKTWLLNSVRAAGLTVKHHADCQFAPLTRLCSRVGLNAFGSPLLVAVDAVLSHLFSWNSRYHRPGFWQKFAPASVFIVAQKTR